VTPALPLHAQVSEDGTTICYHNQSLYEKYLKTLAGQFITVTFQRIKRIRSSRQNRFWRGVYVPMIAQRCGYLTSEHDSVHDELCRLFLGLREDAHPALQIRISSRTLSTAQFSQLIEQTQIWAATTLGLELPDPDPIWRIERADRQRQRSEVH